MEVSHTSVQPIVWTKEKVYVTDKKIQAFRGWSTFILACGTAIASIVASTLAIRKYTGAGISLGHIIFLIISLALIVLGLVLKVIQHCLYETPPDEIRKKIVWSDLKRTLADLPIYKTEEELKEAVDTKKINISSLAKKIDEINVLYSGFVSIYYNPIKDLIPRFEIKSLEEVEKQELLQMAYKIGFIIRFKEDGIRTNQKLVSDFELNESKDVIQQTVARSVEFLANLPSKEENKVSLINAQLRALSVRFIHSTGKCSVLSPSVYLKDHINAVLRKNAVSNEIMDKLKGYRLQLANDIFSFNELSNDSTTLEQSAEFDGRWQNLNLYGFKEVPLKLI